MQLTHAQLATFDKEGWLFFPEIFDAEEMAALREEATRVLAEPREEIRREKSGAPRTAFAVHRYSELFEALAHDPRLVEPLEQIFGEQVYMHQFKINAMTAFTGETWMWHQDFPSWHRFDGMPAPRAMNIALFVDEVKPINGALMLIPRSHTHGALPDAYDDMTTSHPGWYLTQGTVSDMASEGGIVAPTGKPGGLLMFHANMAHGSPPNMTPYPRRIVYLTLSAVSNHLVGQQQRPEFIAHTDFTPVQAGRPGDLRDMIRRRSGIAEPA
ncbi:phytanoyl-CoA dioxygenase family protein [Variovorax sp. KK3]|uniref:phytanoyl-CoA dioxygenase family protein n=1 Tax=Variovorax sp. KK3 TaxID=1855728 RepID=UPI00097C63C9|nr:phytanoyl-CoA dioxygenase family protein [Variovorax sp. KK3]